MISQIVKDNPSPLEGLRFQQGRIVAGIVSFILIFSLQPLAISGYTSIRTYDFGNSELVVEAISCNDSGLAIGAYCYFGGSREYDILLIKTDYKGNLLWVQTYGTDDSEYLHGLTECADKGFLIIGEIKRDIPWFLRIDSSGNMMWNKTYGVNADFARMNDIIELPNKEILAAGELRLEGQDTTKAWLVRLDSNGTIISSTTFGNESQSITCSSLALCQNSDIMLLGHSRDDGNTGSDFWMMRLSHSEQKIWEKTYYNMGNEFYSSSRETHDGGFVLVGTWEEDEYTFADFRMYAICTDSTGNLMWNMSYSGSEEHLGPDDHRLSESTSGLDIIQCDDNGFAIVGATNSFANYFPNNIWLVRTDESGQPVWNNTVKTDTRDYPRSIVKHKYGGFTVIGKTRMNSTDPNNNLLLVYISDIDPANLTTSSTTPGFNEFGGFVIGGAIGGGVIVTIALLWYRNRRSSKLE